MAPSSNYPDPTLKPVRGSFPSEPTVAKFGSFRISTVERVLQKDGVPLKIGSRAFDILITLMQAAPRIVSYRDLMARVWGSLVVDQGSLRFQIASLRKALGDVNSKTPYITNIPGRGYCFAAVVEWSHSAAREGAGAAPALAKVPLPRRPLGMIGRDRELGELVQRLREQRFVSIVGAGGIGKTTLAAAIANEVLSEFGGAAHFLDLAAIEDTRLLASAVASQLGVPVASADPLPAIVAYLREQRILLVFDSCEHLIEAVAHMAEQFHREAPHVHLLITSREALRADGEQVYHLSPLKFPASNQPALTAVQALQYPAVRLFVERVAADGYAFELTDSDAPVVADLCRRLDGIPLALELAARRVSFYGLQGTADLIDDQFRLLWSDRHAALPRHRTLTATLDWSYQLLSPVQQLVLRRLAVFVGAFSLDAALAVVTENLDPAEAGETVAMLVEKSLVALDNTTAVRYRLLDTTRAYAWQKLADCDEQVPTAQRHSEYFETVVTRLAASATKPSSPEDLNFFATHLGNLRAALERCFSEQTDDGLGVRLAAAAVPLFFQLSLLLECITWSERALGRLGSLRDPRMELQLQTCLGIALMSTHGNTPEAFTACSRAYALAEHQDDPAAQLLLLHALYRFVTRSGDYRELADITARCVVVAKRIQDPLADSIAHALTAITHHYVGHNREVLPAARLALQGPLHSSQLNAMPYAYVHRTGVNNMLSRSLWLLGFAQQSLQLTTQNLHEAEQLHHPPTLAYAFAWSTFVYLQAGHWDTAEELIDRSVRFYTRHSLSTYFAVAACWEGMLEIARGSRPAGIERLQGALSTLRQQAYGMYRRLFAAALADAQLQAGDAASAYEGIAQELEWARRRGPSSDLPELLRVMGDSAIALDRHDGEQYLLEALALAREQAALVWELRAAMSLSRLWAARGAHKNAAELLGGAYARFSEGFEVPDLISARQWLTALRAHT